jgi:cell division protein FtsN
MAERESQFITISRQGILIATAMGVGLLTFCYVIGVQVGKRSLTQKNVKVKSLDEELKDLPEPLDVQISIFKSMENNSAPKRNDRSKSETPTPDAPKSATASNSAKPVAATVPNTPSTPKPAIVTEKYTAQAIAAENIDRARRVSEHLNSEGIPTKVVFSNGMYKVQLDWSGSRTELSSRLSRIQSLGYKPIAVKIQ